MRAGSLAVLLTRAAVAAGLLASLGGGPAAGGETAGGEAPPSLAAAIYEGYLRFNGVCGYCHGPDGAGSTFAPSLVDRPIDPGRFRAVVLEGSRTSASVMRGLARDPNVVPYIDAIYAYLDARWQGRLGRGRPPKP